MQISLSVYFRLGGGNVKVAWKFNAESFAKYKQCHAMFVQNKHNV